MAIAAPSTRLLRNPNPNLLRRLPRRLSALRPPPSALAISAVALPSLTPSGVIQLARPLPRLLLASVRSIPSHLSAAAARTDLVALRNLFLSALANRHATPHFFHAPLQAALSGTATCIALYAEILNLRVMLMWFPNIPWERQPFSAIRDLCDPFLTLCRMIIPPIKSCGNLDISPLLAFWALGVLSSLLSGNPPPTNY